MSAAADQVWADLVRERPVFAGAGRADRPAIAVNMVMGLDGRTTIGGRVGPLTDTVDQAILHRLRRESDAVLVGAQTVRVEGYARLLSDADRAAREAAGRPPEPLLCLVTGSAAFAPGAPVLGPAPGPLVLLTGPDAPLPEARREVIALRGAERRLALVPLLRRLRDEHGVRRIVCEGGATLNAALLAEDAVDELFVTLSPMLTNEPAGPGLAAAPGHSAGAVPLRLAGRAAAGDHVFLRYATCG